MLSTSVKPTAEPNSRSQSWSAGDGPCAVWAAFAESAVVTAFSYRSCFVRAGLRGAAALGEALECLDLRGELAAGFPREQRLDELPEAVQTELVAADQDRPAAGGRCQLERAVEVGEPGVAREGNQLDRLVGGDPSGHAPPAAHQLPRLVELAAGANRSRRDWLHGDDALLPGG
jgi:hypothetical protein